MSSTGCQINPIDVNFHLQKSLEFVEKNLSRKNLNRKGQGDKSIPRPSCQLGSICLKSYCHVNCMQKTMNMSCSTIFLFSKMIWYFVSKIVLTSSLEQFIQAENGRNDF